MESSQNKTGNQLCQIHQPAGKCPSTQDLCHGKSAANALFLVGDDQSLFRVDSTHLETASPCFRDILKEEREGPCECKLSEPGLVVVRLPDMDPKAFSLVYCIVSESATSEFWAGLQFEDIYRMARFTNEFAVQSRMLHLIERLLEMEPRSLQDASFAMLAAYQVDLTVPFCRASKKLIHSDDGLNPKYFRFLRNPIMEKMFLYALGQVQTRSMIHRRELGLCLECFDRISSAERFPIDGCGEKRCHSAPSERFFRSLWTMASP